MMMMMMMMMMMVMIIIIILILISIIILFLIIIIIIMLVAMSLQSQEALERVVEHGVLQDPLQVLLLRHHRPPRVSGFHCPLDHFTNVPST